jgi:hypothetical protein
MVMTIDVINVKSTTFITTFRLVIRVILVVNVCNHICNYYIHMCDYNVDIIKWSHKCDYNLWLLHVSMEKNESAHFSSNIMNGSLDGWKLSCLCNSS